MKTQLLATMSSVFVACAFAQDNQPFDREYRKTAEWIAAGDKVPAVKQPADVRSIKTVRLVADRGARGEGEMLVLGTGIPLKQGMVKDVAEMGMRDAHGALPAVFEKRTVYPDGSLQWVWADFVGKAGAECWVTIRSGAGALPQPGGRASAAGEEITVNNGVLELKWNKGFASPMSVSLIAAGRKIPVGQGDGKGIYFVSASGKRYVLGGELSELDFKIETSNALRAVLRLEGWYVSEKGERSGRALMRYDIGWNEPFVRVTHRFIVTDDNDRMTYREIGAQFPAAVASSAVARFGVADTKPVETRLGPSAREAWLMQEKYPLYYKKDKRIAVGVNNAATASVGEVEGWADLNADGAGMVLAVREFAPQFPKELTAGARGLTAKLWSGRTGLVLDYKPATMAKDWWEDWLDRIEYSREWGVNRKRDDGKKETGYTGNKPIITAEMVKKSEPSCVGAARTHELLVGWYAGDFQEQRARQWTAALNRPAVVQPDPAWTMHVDRRVVMPSLARSEVPQEYQVIERGISTFLDMLLLPREVFPYTGWYEWGKHPDLSYERLRDGRVFAQWWRLDNLNYYYYNWNLAHHWMRTGERKFLDELERVNRFLGDYAVIHWDGGRCKKKRGYLPTSGAFGPFYWDSRRDGFNEGSSTEPVTGWLYEYFLRDNRNYLDAFANMRRVIVEEFQNPQSETADMMLAMMCGLYRYGQDPALLEKAKSYFAVMTDPASDIGLRTEWWRGPRSYTQRDRALYKAHRKAFNLMQYYDITGDESAPPIIGKLHVAGVQRYQKEFTQPFAYQHRNGANGARLYEWTGDEDMLFWARHQVVGAKEVLERFLALPEAERNAEYFAKHAGGSTRVFDKVSFPSLGPTPGKGLIYFGGDAFPSTISIPMALWALQGFPGQ